MLLQVAAQFSTFKTSRFGALNARENLFSVPCTDGSVLSLEGISPRNYGGHDDNLPHTSLKQSIRLVRCNRPIYARELEHFFPTRVTT